MAIVAETCHVLVAPISAGRDQSVACLCEHQVVREVRLSCGWSDQLDSSCRDLRRIPFDNKAALDQEVRGNRIRCSFRQCDFVYTTWLYP